MTQKEREVIVRLLTEIFDCDTDNDGQIIIYTDVFQDDIEKS